jgi:hypothetical protein
MKKFLGFIFVRLINRTKQKHLDAMFRVLLKATDLNFQKFRDFNMITFTVNPGMEGEDLELLALGWFLTYSYSCSRGTETKLARLTSRADFCPKFLSLISVMHQHRLSCMNG